jgi:hypothetical protein
MACHFPYAVVGRICYPYAMLARIDGTDGIEARTKTADDTDLRPRGENAVVDWGVLNEKTLAAFGGCNDILLGTALSDDYLDSRFFIE